MNLLFSLCSEVFFWFWRAASKLSVQIGEILEGVPMGEPKFGTGVMGDTNHLLLNYAAFLTPSGLSRHR